MARSKQVAAKTAQYGTAGETEGSRILGMLQRIDMLLNLMSERDNLKSFAVAGPPPHPLQAALSGNAAAQPPSAIVDRLGCCERIGENLDARISELFGRVMQIEAALYGAPAQPTERR